MRSVKSSEGVKNVNASARTFDSAPKVRVMPSAREELLTAEQVAEILQISKKLVYDLRRAGWLKAMRLGGLKWRRSTVNEFIIAADGMDFSDPRNPVPLNE